MHFVTHYALQSANHRDHPCNFNLCGSFLISLPLPPPPLLPPLPPPPLFPVNPQPLSPSFPSKFTPVLLPFGTLLPCLLPEPLLFKLQFSTLPTATAPKTFDDPQCGALAAKVFGPGSMCFAGMSAGSVLL
ncbi:hypothetical protein Hanom_Chr01g00085661 [Helianthus anomalus]